jgi:hypothetical protein
MSVSALSSSSSAQLLQALFQKTDADSNGGLSIDELFSSSRVTGADRSQATSLFSSVDTSSDSLISQTELKTAFDRMSSDMRSTLISATQEDASRQSASSGSSSTLLDAANAYSGAAKGGSEGGGAPPPRGGGSAPSAGGGAGGASESSESDGTTDAADANGDGVVTAAEQAAYDAEHPAAAKANASSSSGLQQAA